MERRNTSKPVLTILPGVGWEIIFLLLPFLAIVVISFLSRGEYGEIERPWTFENYQRLAGFGIFGFEPLYPLILLRSFLMGAATALLCAAAALPLAFWIASLRGGWRIAGLIAVTIPVWTNLLVRTYAWQVLLAPEGWITRLFALVGLGEPGQALYPSPAAVYVGMVCDYLPFAVLPLYAAIERLDHGLVEAAKDLGARRWSVFRHGIYPQIRAGLWAGLLLVFLPATGQFVIPDLLGGGKTILLGNLLQQQFGASRDWPFGAAIATVAIALVLVGLFVFSRIVRRSKGELL